MSTSLTIGLIGGSGLGDALIEGMAATDVREQTISTPFGEPSGPITTGRIGDVTVAMLQRHGPGHVLRPSAVPFRANIFALKSLGCTHVLASGATGSLQENIHPGDLLICDQVIDRTEGRERTFYEHAAVHVELAEPFCPVMREWLLAAARGLEGTTVHERGTYVCMEGPAFSTRAESELHRAWGAHLIGMTVMPEARLAREAELAYAMVSLPTDYDCWRPHDPATDAKSLLQEIIGNLQTATAASIALIKAALADVSLLAATPSPAHDALALAIWSDKAQISPEAVERLRPLWGRHFA
ncbi:MAG: S-methyl-5'-thioadenosine phosphorylase [Planctomycetota bacterium]|jgi:5'-methylthioadenosine phosphorylase